MQLLLMKEIYTDSSAQRLGCPFPAIVQGTVCTGFCGTHYCIQLLYENEMLIRAEIIVKKKTCSESWRLHLTGNLKYNM